MSPDVFLQIVIASVAMSLLIAAFSLYAGATFRRGRPLSPRIRFWVPTAVMFFGMLGALWGPVPLWTAFIPAILIGFLSGMISRRMTEPDILEVTAYLGKSRPN
jgi:uncharacterized membrane protein YjjB (DUF3815 family)